MSQVKMVTLMNGDGSKQATANDVIDGSDKTKTFSPFSLGMLAGTDVAAWRSALIGIYASGWRISLSAAKSGTNADITEMTAFTDFWAMQPIGVPIPLFTHLTGVTEPPLNKAYRYVKLTAGDAYNSDSLTTETVSGTAPLVLATATINLPGSPLLGQVVRLINTEERVLRGGTSGTALQDALQDHSHPSSATSGASQQLMTAGGIGCATSGSTTGTVSGARVANETRAKSVGVTYYLRIK